MYQTSFGLCCRYIGPVCSAYSETHVVRHGLFWITAPSTSRHIANRVRHMLFRRFALAMGTHPRKKIIATSGRYDYRSQPHTSQGSASKVLSSVRIYAGPVGIGLDDAVLCLDLSICQRGRTESGFMDR